MAQKKSGGAAYEALASDIKNGSLGPLYIFYGEERYLMAKTLESIRRALVPGASADFNHRRYEGAGLTADEIVSAVDTLPVFSQRTLVEVRDFDLFKCAEESKQRLTALFSDMPDYACLIFLYDTMEYRPDGRQKFTAELKKRAKTVEFSVQEQLKLVRWIRGHFEEAGKRISSQDAEYLIFLTGGYMSALDGEIEKVSAYAKGERVERADIDAVVAPALDAVTYKLTDAIIRRGFDDAARLLYELLEMREPPRKILYSVSLKLRQLLSARVLLSHGMGERELMEITGIRYEFQARALLSAARAARPGECERAVLRCAEAAYAFNDGGDPDAGLVDLLLSLAAGAVQ